MGLGHPVRIKLSLFLSFTLERPGLILICLGVVKSVQVHFSLSNDHDIILIIFRGPLTSLRKMSIRETATKENTPCVFFLITIIWEQTSAYFKYLFYYSYNKKCLVITKCIFSYCYKNVDKMTTVIIFKKMYYYFICLMMKNFDNEKLFLKQRIIKEMETTQSYLLQTFMSKKNQYLSNK